MLPQKSRSRLLDILDSSFSPNTQPVKPERSIGPLPISSQNNDSPMAASSSSALLRQAIIQRTQGGLAYAAPEFNMRAESDTEEEEEKPVTLALMGRGALLTDSGGFNIGGWEREDIVTAIDVGGPDQAQKMADFVTNSINNLSNGLTVNQAIEKLGLKDIYDVLPGMEVRLLPHQIVGVSWMLEQEKGKHQGGILADDMGLGKTVQLIATMVANQPSIDSKTKTTLVVVPTALLLQWEEEFQTKTNGIFSVHIHHGKDKLKKLHDISDKDVIITSYQTLAGDFDTPGSIEDMDVPEWLAEHGGVLARTKFYRVVADEAQFIRNRLARTSRSMALIRAKYRWCLTGTPITNSLTDIYGLLRFGKFRPWNHWEDFNVHVSRMQKEDANLAAERAQAILKPVLLRRTKNSTLEGQPILQLPVKDMDFVFTELSKDERELYDHLEGKSQVTINRFKKAGTLLKNHVIILTLLLRLRQMCAHPNLVLAYGDENNLTAAVGTDEEKEWGRALKLMGAPWVSDVKKRLTAKKIIGIDAEQATCAKCDDVFIPESGRVLKCGDVVCSDCLEDLKNGTIEHDGIFGNGDEGQNLAQERQWDNALTTGLRPCPTCKKMMSLRPDSVFKLGAFMANDKQSDGHSSRKHKIRRKYDSDEDSTDADEDRSMKKSSFDYTFDESSLDRELSDDDDLPEVGEVFAAAPPAKKKPRLSDENDDDALTEITVKDIFSDLKLSNSNEKSPQPATRGRPRKDVKEAHNKDLYATWSKGNDDLEPSSKMLAMLKLLKEWDDSGDKTIIYSQWTSNLDLIEKLFARHSIRSYRYDGKMDRVARETVLAKFKKSGGPRVILISTKCGGVGLNLVAANRIINMDVSWNFASESQAYDRVHRLGQHKDVVIRRMVAKDTIEERMLKLQDVKTGLSDGALGEGTGPKLHKLSVKDITALFGMTEEKKEQIRQLRRADTMTPSQ